MHRSQQPPRFRSNFISFQANQGTCRPIETRLWHREFLSGVMPENILCATAERTRVLLWEQWAGLFNDLREVGRVLVITRNPHAVLGHYYEAYPRLEFREDETLASGVEAELAFALGGWHHACATQVRDEGKVSYGLEFFDNDQEIVHKVCLTPDSNLAAFFNLVCVHQGIGPELSIRQSDAARLCYFKHGADEQRSFDLLRFRSWLEQLITYRLPVKVLTGNPCASQAHVVILDQVQCKVPWLFLRGDCMGIHLQLGMGNQVTLQRLRGPQGKCWSVEVSSASGQLAAAFLPPDDGDLDQWHELLRWSQYAC